MDSKELMLGDWVYVPHNGSATHYARVIGIYSRDVVSTELDKMSGLIKADALEPIPLIPEILEKNGFEHRGNTWILADDYYDVTMHEWSDSIWVFRYECCEMDLPHTQKIISFLHELNHSFRDCGIEKEITI